jgi:hypothetical protein
MALPEYPSSAINVKPKLSPSNATPLAATPNTPALIPTQPEEEEDDDWDHITEFQENKGVAASGGDEDDGDIIILGEIELEEVVAEKAKSDVKGKGGKLKKEKTYAGAVRTA